MSDDTTTPAEDEVEGHRMAGLLPTDDNDVEGHRMAALPEDDNDVEGHRAVT